MQNKNVIVTGGASGIGKATALLLARNGARVFIGDVDVERGTQVVADAVAIGHKMEFLSLELTDPSAIDAFTDAVQARAGRVNALVNAAGWDIIQPFMDNETTMWDRVIAINLMGPIRLTRNVLKGMIESGGGGKIVSISSDAGRVGSMGETVYAGAKGGIIAFSKSLAREMARHRVNVNVVCPGPTNTPLFQRQPDRMKDALTKAIPFRRIAEPEEVAEAVMFFASDRSSYITAQVLSVSGGLTMVG
ncbi:MAG: SDR family oxidoreductase [Acetobacteraceae bacterium]|nr:SDR family oxidoreductase [Acetobacteraceae bacterium]